MMRQLASSCTVVAAVAAILVAACAAYGGEGVADSPKRLKLDADDLVDVTGLNVYKFQVGIPKNQRFWVVLREFSEEGREPRVLHRYRFRKRDEAPAVLRVAFLRRDRKIRGVLLSQGQDAEYRIDVPGCTPGGIATIVSLPLADVDPTRKTLFVHGTGRDQGHVTPGEVRLLTIVVSEPGKPAPPLGVFPRAELVIQREE